MGKKELRNNLRKLDKKLNFITSLAALVASIIAIFTLFEIKKQRETSYLPDIAVHNSNIFVRDSVSNEKCFYDGKLKYSKDSLDSKKEGIKMKIENIGFGTAKSVQMKFEYDNIKISNLLNKVDRESEVFFQRNENKGHLEIVSYDNLECRKRFYNNILNEYNFEFILPSQDFNKNYFIEFPPEYVVTSLRYALKRKLYEENFPPLILEMEYTDVGGKVIQKKIELHIIYETYELVDKIVSAKGTIRTGKRKKRDFIPFGREDSMGRRTAFKTSGDDARLIIFEEY